MLRVIDYKFHWIVKNGRAKKLAKPIYEDQGKGGGLENRKSLNKQFIKQIESLI